MTRKGIVLAGTVVLDIVNIIDHWPDEEQIALMERTIHAPGGPPHNAAAALVKLGAPFPVSLLGVVGSDGYADIFIEKAAGYGVDTSGLQRIEGAVTSHTHVMSTAKTGKRTFFLQIGVNAELRPEHVLPTNDTAKIYYLGSPGLSSGMDASDGWRHAFSNARDRGFQTAMELCPVAPDLQKRQVVPCLPLLNYFVINDSEAEAVGDVDVTKQGHFDWRAAEKACRQFLDMGVQDLAVIHHPQGAVGVMRDGSVAMAGSVKVPREDIIGSVGAGDAFYAGVLFGLHEGWDLQSCLELGNASAATSLASATTSAAIRPYTECLAYAAKCGVRDVL